MKKALIGVPHSFFKAVPHSVFKAALKVLHSLRQFRTQVNAFFIRGWFFLESGLPAGSLAVGRADLRSPERTF